MDNPQHERGSVRALPELLYALYKYRALTTVQVRKLTGYGARYIYDKLRRLRKEGYIISQNVKGGYILNQKRQGKYHRLSQKGIYYLKEHGYDITQSADDLRVSDKRLPYLLVGNDLSLELEMHGWEFKDSREVKKLESVNRGDVLHGTLTNPNKDKEYLVYVLLQSVQTELIRQIKNEINRINIPNALVVTRGEQSFNTTLSIFREKGNPLIKGGSVKVLPFQFAKHYLKISTDCLQNHERFLSELGIKVLGGFHDKSTLETNIHFDYLIEFDGEEMYLVDLLDNDLMKMLAVQEYRYERYSQDGRRVLVLTSDADFHREIHRDYLGSFHHIVYLPLNLNSVMSFTKALPF